MFNAKPFRDGDLTHSYPCRPCECYGHATSCVYNATLDAEPTQHDLGGGGQCINCADNTAGTQCETCADGFFRLNGTSLYAQDVCVPCNCSRIGSTDDNDCDKVRWSLCCCTVTYSIVMSKWRWNPFRFPYRSQRCSVLVCVLEITVVSIDQTSTTCYVLHFEHLMIFWVCILFILGWEFNWLLTKSEGISFPQHIVEVLFWK